MGGTIGVFAVTVDAGQSKPALTQPQIQLSFLVSTGATGGTLTLQLSDTNFAVASSAVTMTAADTLSGSVTATYTGYVDSSNALFGTGTTVGSFVLTSTNTGTATGPGEATTPYSMTAKVVAAMAPESGFSLAAFNLSGTPVPPPLPSPLGKGDTATIGFWHNKNGQAVIDSLNGSSSSTALGTWLASHFHNLFGNLNGKTNADVAAFYLANWPPSGVTLNTYVQAFAVALACYVTSTNLAGTNATAASFGFNSSPGGTCAKTFNVGGDGATVGLSNNASYTVLQLLEAFNAAYPVTSQSVVSAWNDIFNGINEGGDIS